MSSWKAHQGVSSSGSACATEVLLARRYLFGRDPSGGWSTSKSPAQKKPLLSYHVLFAMLSVSSIVSAPARRPCGKELSACTRLVSDSPYLADDSLEQLCADALSSHVRNDRQAHQIVTSSCETGRVDASISAFTAFQSLVTRLSNDKESWQTAAYTLPKVSLLLRECIGQSPMLGTWRSKPDAWDIEHI